MITDKTVSVHTDNSEAWKQLPWRKCQKVVIRLQRRIVKAVQQGRWGKVKALQLLLTRSFSSKALAVKRVTENQGKNTAGVDRQLWLTWWNYYLRTSRNEKCNLSTLPFGQSLSASLAP